MSNSPIERIASLTIGTIEAVSSNEISVLLVPDAPQTTSINTGIPTGFPRVNGYVLVPNECGALVGQVSFIGIEKSPYPKRPGLKDFGLIDLPFPLRKLRLTPVGTLVAEKRGSVEAVLKLNRGVSILPSVGDSVLVPTPEQLRAIIERQGVDARVAIGTAPLAAGATVTVDPDKLFGRHLAVLGNTGGGKSCSVAGLIRWSLEAASKSLKAGTTTPNARFLILDPNGEYARAFADMPSVRIFQVPPTRARATPLKVPAWLWNSQEWSAFVGAQPGTQRPLLMQALRELRAGQHAEDTVERRVFSYLRSSRTQLAAFFSNAPVGGWGDRMSCGRLIAVINDDATQFAVGAKPTLAQQLGTIATAAAALQASHGFPWQQTTAYQTFSAANLQSMLTPLDAALALQPAEEAYAGPTEDTPTPFDVMQLAEYLRFLTSTGEQTQLANFIGFLALRIKNLMSDQRMAGIVTPDEDITLEQWLGGHVGESNAANGQLAIIDLSLVPTDVVHVIIAVIARLVFEAIQRYRRLTGKELPTVLVLEEAHTFVRKGSDEDNLLINPARMCRETFEKIAREGRKFGLGLVISSQRPSELSGTVLAQCNTFLLHRIVNDLDRSLVSKLVPDNLGGLLEELPNLPSQQAVLLGWAAPVPVLVEINELPENQRPHSDDPQFWKVWTGELSRPIDWPAVAQEWQGVQNPPAGQQAAAPVAPPSQVNPPGQDEDIPF
jgi:hypothetical protein